MNMDADKARLGAILAGGQGRRLGGADKGLLSLGGKCFAEIVAGRMRPHVGAIVVVAPQRPDWLDQIDPAGFVEDTGGAGLEPGRSIGPADGLLGALTYAATLSGAGFEHVVTAPLDVPNFPVSVFDQLAAVARPGEAALAQARGQIHPSFGLWPVSLAGAVAEAVEARQVRALHRIGQAVGARFVEIDGPEGAFFNVNTPEDLARIGGINPAAGR